MKLYTAIIALLISICSFAQSNVRVSANINLGDVVHVDTRPRVHHRHHAPPPPPRRHHHYKPKKHHHRTKVKPHYKPHHRPHRHH